MKSTCISAIRFLCLALSICLVAGGLVSCGGESEIPEGYQYATCNGEYFRLFLPTAWTVSTESGVSGGYTYVYGEVAVSMVEVPFVFSDRVEETPVDTASVDTAAEALSESVIESEAETTADTVVNPVDTAAETAASTDNIPTLQDFYVAHMAEISRLPGYTYKRTVDTTMNGTDNGKRAPAKDVTYSAIVGGITYDYRQVLSRVEKRFYLFTCSYNAEAYKALPEEQQLKLDGIIEEIRGNILFSGKPFTGSEDDRKIPDVDTPDGMKLVSDNDVPYRFFAPESWQTVPGSAAAQVYASETDRSNVSVIGFVPDTEGVSVADFWEKTHERYQTTLENFQLISVTEGQTMGGLNATVYEYTYTIGGVDYHTRQAICVYSYMIVSMTYTALPENYEAHLPEAEAMQAALTFRRKVLG